MASKTETKTKKPEKEDVEKKELDKAALTGEDPAKKDKKLMRRLLDDIQSEQVDTCNFRAESHYCESILNSRRYSSLVLRPNQIFPGTSSSEDLSEN